jgi:hypothetical protein
VTCETGVLQAGDEWVEKEPVADNARNACCRWCLQEMPQTLVHTPMFVAFLFLR